MEAAGLAFGVIPLAVQLAKGAIACYTLITALPEVANAHSALAHDLHTEQLRLQRWRDGWALGDDWKTNATRPRLDPTDFRYRFAVATLARILAVFASIEIMSSRIGGPNRRNNVRPERKRRLRDLLCCMSAHEHDIITEPENPDPAPTSYLETLLLDAGEVRRLENPACLESKTLEPGLVGEIADLEAASRKAQDALSTRQKVKWELVHKGRMHELLERLRRYNDQLYEVLPLNLELNEIQSVVNDEKTRHLLGMLTPLEPIKRHQDIRQLRMKGTGKWILVSETFLKWQNSEMSGQPSVNVMCAYGIPGAGKSIICSRVFDHLRQMAQDSEGSIAAICMYCDYRDVHNQTATNIIGSILKQLIIALPRTSMSHDVVKSLQELVRQDMKVERRDMANMLAVIIPCFTKVFLCVDALDELEQEARTSLLSFLKSDLPVVSMFFTGRHPVAPEITRVFESVGVVEVTAVHEDIRVYLDNRIEEDPDPEAMSDALRQEILSSLPAQSEGMFLLPKLQINMILALPTISKRRASLKTLPTTLDAAFEETIARMKASCHADLGLRVLLWLHFMYTKARFDLLAQALSVEPEHTDLDPENVVSKKQIVKSCFGLVVIDEETQTVRFVHYTLEEYFRKHAPTIFPDGHAQIARTCLTFMNFPLFKEHVATIQLVEKMLEQHPFLGYAAENWGRHLRGVEDEDILTLAKKATMHPINRPSVPFQWLYVTMPTDWPEMRTDYDVGSEFSRFHAIAYFGLDRLVRRLANEPHWDAQDGVQFTPLSYAIHNGHDAVVELLLERTDVNPNTIHTLQRDGRTALELAIQKNNTAVALRLINHPRFDPNRVVSRMSVFKQCLYIGREAVTLVRALLARTDFDVNRQGPDGTCLHIAADMAREQVVELLLARDDIDVNACHDESQYKAVTPLMKSLAPGRNLDSSMPLISDPRVDVNACRGDGTPVVILAVRCQSWWIIENLLKRTDLKPNVPDAKGFTALVWAVLMRGASEDVIHTLLKCSEVDCNVRACPSGHSDRISLPGAAEIMQALQPLLCLVLLHPDDSTQERIALKMLARPDLDVNARGAGNRTPLMYAAWRHSFQVVLKLLERDDIDVHAVDENGLTALQYAEGACKEETTWPYMSRGRDRRHPMMIPLIKAFLKMKSGGDAAYYKRIRAGFQ